MRKGFYTSGNWLVDKIKFINSYPKEGMFSTISSIHTSGGGIYNTAIDLSVMDRNLPIYAAGLIGKDSEGDFLLNKLLKNGIDTSGIKKTDKLPTSFTDVMTASEHGARTFFHLPGANSLLKAEDILSSNNNAKIFHLAYLLILDGLDAEDPEYGVIAARLFKTLQERGYKTSADVVSDIGNRFQKVVIPCLKYLDYFIINEIEASEITNIEIRKPDDTINLSGLKTAAEKLMEYGVNDSVIIHYPEAAFGINKNGETAFINSLQIEKSRIKSSVGAGDSFCAGALYALHEEMSLNKVLQVANISASYNLFSETATGGAVSYKVIENDINKHYKGI